MQTSWKYIIPPIQHPANGECCLALHFRALSRADGAEMELGWGYSEISSNVHFTITLPPFPY